MRDLSIVMSARNDNYGGKVYREGPEPAVPTPQKDRMRLSFKTLHEAFKDIDYEVVFVEWNPVEGKEKISDWDFMRHPRIRIIEVSKQVSDEILRGEKDFHEMHAKNVGIRRAKGWWILGSNPDVLWLNPFPRAIRIERKSVVISYRWTVFHHVLEYTDNLSVVSEYCQNSNNCIDYDLNSNGDFTLMHQYIWHELKGYSIPKDLSMVAGLDIQMVRRAEAFGCQKIIMPSPIYHLRHPGKPLKSCVQEIVEVSDGWGLPQYKFKEYRDGKEIDNN